MPDDQPFPDRLAVLVSDGGAIDWEEALQRASSDEERSIIRQLRLVDSVAKVHRTAEPPAPLAPAIATWAQLDLREKLGEGAFGEVFLAWDRRLNREVALKLLKAEVSAGKGFASAVVEEGRLLAKLRHPNVVTVYGAEIDGGRVGIWMEFIRGRSLEQLLREQGPFGAREAALIGIELCRALAAVHGAGVIHRDVKAQNVMREEGGRILLTDFGAGVDLGAGAAARDERISGTPFYMAPEIIRGEPATHQSDVYAVGVLLYRLVTAGFPIEAKTWNELRDKHARRDVKLLRDRRPDLPGEFVAGIERAIAFDRADRFATAGQMEQALSLALGAASGPGPAASARRRTPYILGAVLAFAVVLAVVGAMVATSRAGKPGVRPIDSGSARPLPARSEPASVTATPAAASYTVEAAFFRQSRRSVDRSRLEPGDRLAIGDRLTLEFKATAPLHVYVIDEDEAGHSYALFPLPGLDQENPLQPGTTHVLPGSRDGKALSWTVDTPGGREHLLVLASPARLVEFEAEMNALARPGQTAVAIPDATKGRLRGIGGLSEVPVASGAGSAGPLFELAQRLASRSEVASGVWLRRVEFENPHSD